MSLLENFKRSVEATEDFFRIFFGPKYIVKKEHEEVFEDYFLANKEAKIELNLINKNLLRKMSAYEVPNFHLDLIEKLILGHSSKIKVEDLFFEHERIRDALVSSFNSEKLRNWDFSGHNLRPYEERHEKRYESLRDKFYSKKNN